MRRLGDKPLTGAEKQKRHRERVKARLEEAAALKERFLARDLEHDLGRELAQENLAQENLAQAFGAAGAPAGLSAYYGSLLRELGASAEEAQALTATLADAQGELALLLRARGQAALENWRARKKRCGVSLLARLAAAGSMDKG